MYISCCALLSCFLGLRVYLRKTVEECREKGYVSTISGRRRYLPSITSMNPHARAQVRHLSLPIIISFHVGIIQDTAGLLHVKNYLFTCIKLYLNILSLSKHYIYIHSIISIDCKSVICFIFILMHTYRQRDKLWIQLCKVQLQTSWRQPRTR